MIVVTGHPNSGTSLVMQLCKHLGLDVKGNVFPFEVKSNQNPHILKFQHKKIEGYTKNPHGFYEDTWTFEGVQTNQEGVFKVMPWALATSSFDVWDKLIVCIRNPSIYVNPKVYVRRMTALYKLLQKTTKPFLVVDYDALFLQKNITKLCLFLGIAYKQCDSVIDTSLNRSVAVNDNLDAQHIYEKFTEMIR